MERTGTSVHTYSGHENKVKNNLEKAIKQRRQCQLE